jgi:hypothetical protein
MSHIQVLTLSLSDLPISRFFNRFNLNQKWDMWLEILVPSLPPPPTLFPAKPPPFHPLPSVPYRHSFLLLPPSPFPFSFPFPTSVPQFLLLFFLRFLLLLSSFPLLVSFASFFVLLLPFYIVSQPFLIPFSIFCSSRICKLLFSFASLFIS